MYDKKQNNEENFWISYADLMAGLLFVFILVIGAIIIKYLYAQTDLKTIKTDLDEQKKALNLSEEELSNKKRKLAILNKELYEIQEEKIHLSFELAKSKNKFNETKLELEEERQLALKLSNDLENKTKNLQLSNEQIKNITAILEDKENNIKLLNKSIEDEKNLFLLKMKEINLNIEEIDKLKALLFDYELKETEQNEIKEKLSSKVKNQENMISLKDEELLMLENKLLIQSKIHQKLVEEFDITKVKIKHLTGIKINVISKLKNKLGKSINIDNKNGAITFSSNILFDQGKYTLKEESKKELSIILKKYLQALLDDESIRKYIHSITIEGHTNSDGTYLDNLALSQQRALEVMQFLYSSQIADKNLLEKYVNASGRSFSDIVFKNGIEDKDNSRRIEIKFRIKNEAAIKELQNFLGKK
jgi:chemotaxis protein MotB